MIVEVILPKSVFDVNKFSSLYKNHMRMIGLRVQGDFNLTTKTWKHKPKFTVKRDTDSVTISTDDDIYALVEAGSPRHPIFPRRARRLVFPNKYKAKTTPGIIGSKSGGKSGTVVIATKIPDHPGFQARKFVNAIKEKNDKIFQSESDRIVTEANA